MALLGTLQVRMGLDTASFGQKFNSFTKDLEKRASSFSKGLSGLTNFGSLVGGAGIGAALSQGISIAADFEKTMNKVAAAANVGAEGMQGLVDVVSNATKGTIFSMNDGAEGLLALQKAGQTVAQSQSSLAEALKLAAAEGSSFEEAAELMVKTLNQFGLKAEESARVSDALAGGAAASTASLTGLKESLKAVGTNAAAMGLDLHETIGMFALFADRALEGSDAGTSAKTMLQRLVPTTDKAAEAMAKYGLKFTDAKGNMVSITNVFDQLQQKMGKLSESERSAALGTIFGTDAIRAANIAVKDGGSSLQRYIDLTKDKAAAEKAAEAGSKGFAGAMLRLKNNISGLFIEKSGQSGFLKFLEEMATKANGLVDGLKGLPPEFFKIAIGIAAGLAVLPAFALAISSVVTAIPALLTGIGAVAGFLTGPWGLALVAAVGAAVLFKDQIITGWGQLKEWFAGWVQENQPLLQSLKDAWAGFMASFGPLFEAAKVAITNFASEVAKAFGGNSTSLFDRFKTAASTALQWIVHGATIAIQGLTAFVNWISGNLPAAGTVVGQVVAGIIGFFQRMGTSIASAWQWTKDAFASAWNYMSSGFATMMEKLQPLGEAFRAWGQVAAEVFGVVKDAWGLVWDALKLGFAGLLEALTPVWEQLKSFGSWVATTFGPPLKQIFNEVKEVGIALWTGMKTAIQDFWDFCKTAVAGIVATFQDLGNKALAPLRSLRQGIDDARNALNVFGDTGEEVKGKAVDNSWLKDLCDLGIWHFNQLKTAGILPTQQALTDFGKTGQQVQGMMKGVTSGSGSLASGTMTAATLNETAKRQFNGVAQSSQQAAIQVQSTWTSAMNHVGSAIDEFVKTGKLNFSDLVRSIIADIASAALKNAFNGLLQGIMGIAGGGAGTSGSSGGNWLSGIGSIFGSILGGFGSFEGGGYTGNGARAGGLDGRGGRLAMIHPRETVIDHTRVKKSARPGPAGGIHVSTPITLMPGVSKEELAEILPMLKRDIIETIPRLIQLGGNYAGAYGQ